MRWVDAIRELLLYIMEFLGQQWDSVRGDAKSKPKEDVM
jgi:hypothetical protein